MVSHDTAANIVVQTAPATKLRVSYPSASNTFIWAAFVQSDSPAVQHRFFRNLSPENRVIRDVLNATHFQDTGGRVKPGYP